MCKRENLSQMIKYATRNPQNQEDKDIAYKYVTLPLSYFLLTDIV